MTSYLVYCTYAGWHKAKLTKAHFISYTVFLTLKQPSFLEINSDEQCDSLVSGLKKFGYREWFFLYTFVNLVLFVLVFDIHSFIASVFHFYCLSVHFFFFLIIKVHLMSSIIIATKISV